LLSTAPEIWLRQFHQSFMASGFVSYYKHNPLNILAGKRKRTYGIDKDSCWALVGALGIEDKDIIYDENVPMKEVKRRLLVALIDNF
jgi:hypothetical protein